MYIASKTHLQRSPFAGSLVYALQHLPIHADPQALGEDGVVIGYRMFLGDELRPRAGHALGEVGGL